MNDFNDINWATHFSFNIHLVDDNVLGESHRVEALFVMVQLLKVNLIGSLHVVLYLRKYLVASVHILQFFL